MLVRLHTEVEEMEAGRELGLAEGMDLVVGREVVVDMELGSVPENALRNSAAEGTGFDSHPVVAVVCSSEQEDIVVEKDTVPGLEGDIAADHKELAGAVEADLRNIRCLT